jgi:transposase-like protein
MTRSAAPENPPCPRCGHRHTVRNGRTRGRQRWVCVGCAHSFGPTTGTVMYRLQTPPAEVAQALLVVLRRGSLLAAQEVTGHKYETISRWLRRAAAHAEALTVALVQDLHLTEVEVDEFWSFVRHKGGQPKRPAPPRMPRPVRASAGAA